MVGYKQTDIGLIPEDWKVRRINSITSNIIDFRGVTPKKKGMEWGDGDIVALSAGNVKKGYIDFNSECYFGSEELYQRWMTNGDAKKNDIVFTMEAPLGNVALIPDDNKYILSQRTILLQIDTENYHPKFIFQIFLSDSFQTYINNSATGSTAKGLKRITFEKLHLPLPPLPEQEAIAEVLSDTDKLITALEKRIAKKRLIKQGAMQTLLTPKDDWEVKKIKDIVSTPVTDGPHLTPKFQTTGIPFLSVNNLVDNKVDLSDLRYISKEDDKIFSMKCKPQKGDLLFGKAASVGKIAIVEEDIDFNIWSPIALIRLNKENDPKFVYYFFQTNKVLVQISYFTNASSQGNVGMGDIEKIELALPTITEQTRIATILSDMDNEIDALEKKLSKTKELKQGLMQQLLTGKIRLV